MIIENLAEDAEDFTGNVWLMETVDETVLIDAGTGDSWEKIRELDEVSKLVVTHSHYDHVDNLPRIENGYSPEIYSYEPGNLPVEAEKISEGDTIRLCGMEFKVFHTPGHKDDSICLYCEDKEIIFTGDLVFPGGGFGRTDMDEGDREALIESIEKVADLEIQKMFCGHDEKATENVNQQIMESLENAKRREPKH